MTVQHDRLGVFDFLEVHRPAPKPRRSGLTIASDQDYSLDEARGFAETAAPFVDWVKLPDHYGHIARYTEGWLREKIAIYGQAGIRTTLGGVIYEVAVVQNKVPQFFARAAELGLSGVEVSEDVIEPQSAETRSAHIRLAVSAGLSVFTEVGRKYPDAPLDVDAVAEIAARDLEAGAGKIVVENSDIVQIVERNGDELHRLAERIPLDRLVFEIGPAGGARIAAWLFRELGPDVNIENLDLRDAGTLAAQRAGLHRSVGLTFFDRYAVATAAE